MIELALALDRPLADVAELDATELATVVDVLEERAARNG